MLHFQVPKFLPTWVENSLEGGTNILAESNQGTVLLFQDGGMEFVVKVAMGEGAVLKAREATLAREARAYGKMQGLEGIPKCYGMVSDQYLVMEYIRGVTYREAVIEDRETWFARLLDIIQGFHARGVAHGDLKSKSNLMMTDRGQPCVIDFGTTVMHRDGFHPIRNRMYRYAVQLDLNAWVKHKYDGRYEDASPRDQQYLNYSWVEKWLRKRRIAKWDLEEKSNNGAK